MGNGELAKVTNRLMEKKTSAKTGSLRRHHQATCSTRRCTRSRGARTVARRPRSLNSALSISAAGRQVRFCSLVLPL